MTLISMFSSGVSNVIGQSVGHPFDTIKTIVQVDESGKSLNELVTETVDKEGIKSFFKGIE